MNCEQCNTGDNCERWDDIKYREYHDWLIPFKCKKCRCCFFYATYAIQKGRKVINGNASSLKEE